MLQAVGGRVTNIVVFSMHQGHVTDPLFIIGLQELRIVAKGIAVLHAYVYGMLSLLRYPGQVVCLKGQLQVIGVLFHHVIDFPGDFQGLFLGLPVALGSAFSLPDKDSEPDPVHASLLHPGQVDLTAGRTGIVPYPKVKAHAVQAQRGVGMAIYRVGCRMNTGSFFFKFAFRIGTA